MTATITATDIQAVAMLLLVRLVSSSSTFQARLGVDSAEDAEKHIHWPWLQVPEIELSRPCAIIHEGKEYGHKLVAGGYRNEYLPTGALVLTITDNDRYIDNHHDSWIDFRNFSGGVLKDVIEKSGEDDNLDIATPLRTQEAVLSPPNTSTRPYWWEAFEIPWGIAGNT